MEKAKKFFSLKSIDTVHTLSKITVVDKIPRRSDNWGLTWGGFISTDLFWDTRRMVDSRDGSICFYPDNINRDVNGRDINATPSFNMVVMNTRLTLRIESFNALGARISGMIEGWFMGISNTDMNGFAMRHAFLKMDWETTSLLIGQTWHPLFTEHCFAHTVAGSAGSPFQPFARSPQIRLNQPFAKYSNIMLYINAQRDYLSWGRSGPSTEYVRNSAIPEAGLQYIFDYKKFDEEKNPLWSLYFGLGADYKYLIPRLITAGNVYTKKGVHGGALMLFGHYEHHISSEVQFGIKAKAMVAQNCTEQLMMGGYAIKYYDNLPLNDSANYNYTALSNFSSWVDIYANIGSWEVGLFGGYCKNLGALNHIQDPQNPASYFGRGRNIDFLYRISTRMKYNANKIQFAIEPEYTVVKYGNTMTDNGTVMQSLDHGNMVKTNLVHGMRILFSTTLFF